jgi:putative transcriptional regulator
MAATLAQRSRAGRCVPAGLLVAVLLALLAVIGLNGCATPEEPPPGSFAGRLLVAAPPLSDPHFARTVVYVVSHDDAGAFGLVINRAYGEGSLALLMEAFGIDGEAEAGTIRLHYGGPVEGSRGFVLHSADYAGPATVKLANGLALSTGRDVLEALAAGRGPAQRVVLLGYAGWSPGQLDGEIGRADWLIAPADPALIFSSDPAAVWTIALQRAGLPM